MLILLVVATILVLVLTILWAYLRNLPPGPWGLPIIGYLLWIDPQAPYKTLTDLSKKYGSIYCLSLGGVKTVVLTDPKDVRATLVKDSFSGRAPLYVTHGIMKGYDFRRIATQHIRASEKCARVISLKNMDEAVLIEKVRNYECLFNVNSKNYRNECMRQEAWEDIGREMNSTGLICTEGELWRDQRKFIHGCLRQFGAVKMSAKRHSMEMLIMKEVNDMIETIKKIGNPITLDPLEPLRHAIGSVMNLLTFGRAWSIDDKTWIWLQHLQEEGTKHIGVAGPLNFLPFLRFIPKYNDTMKFLLDGKRKTHEFYEKLITAEAKYISEVKNPENLIQAFLKERIKRKNTADLEKFYNDQQFYHILADFFGAGLDTTMATLRWYLLFMAVNPKIQTKIQEEIDEITEGRDLTLEDLPSLPLTEASLAETQRIRSVVPLGIPHGSIEPTEINGFSIPAGTVVIPLQWAIHMDPRYWMDPEKFNPYRFINEEGRFFKPDAFIPFQTGKRMCVGEELARMLLFLFGASVFQKFNVSVPNIDAVDLEGECGITLTPKTQELLFTVRN